MRHVAIIVYGHCLLNNLTVGEESNCSFLLQSDLWIRFWMLLLIKNLLFVSMHDK